MIISKLTQLHKRFKVWALLPTIFYVLLGYPTGVKAQNINRETFGFSEEDERGQLDYPSVDKLVRTKLPYWQVGWIDQSLSRECSLGRFNQRIPYRYSAHFLGKSGSAMVGGVKGTGLNLFDPRRLASRDKDYWFYRDGTAECIVMWAYAKSAVTR
ncbi:MAG: hypothetical protein ORN98_09295 [Alphaproteobacteria bacterium]|nr:hypothetical protein [Alphaproteobacteria bacterium]